MSKLTIFISMPCPAALASMKSDKVDAEALAVFAAHFVQLDDEQQDALLHNVERGVVQTEWPFHPGGFFAMMVQHATEGFYSDPGNGGNRNQVAWEMIGFEVRG